MSESLKKLYASGYQNPRKGKKHTRKSIKKMKLSHKGAKAWNKGKTGVYTDEVKKKMGVKPIGFTGPNLGKKFTAKTRKKLSLALKGKPSPMKGKKHTEESRKNMSNAQKKLYADGYQAPAKGVKRSAETRKRMSLAKKGKSTWNKGIPTAESTKEKIRKARLHQIIPVKDTKPEKDIQKILKDIGIPFEKHKPILGQPDIFIQPNICIFVDGDYWHANPKDFVNKGKLYPGFKKDDRIIGKVHAKDRWARDKSISQRLRKKGYSVLRFWQSELEINQGKCLQKILKAVKK